MFLGENTLNVATVGNILPTEDIVNYELSDGEDEFYQPIPAQDDNGNDEQGKILYIFLRPMICKSSLRSAAFHAIKGYNWLYFGGTEQCRRHRCQAWLKDGEAAMLSRLLHQGLGLFLV